MAGHAWLNPEERRTVINSLKGGANWADSKALVVGTDQGQVDDTFIDTQEAFLTAIAEQENSEVSEGPAARATAFGALVTPVVTSITPATGDAGGGETKTIVGTGFYPGATVSIGGHAQTVLSVNKTTIRIKTVAHAAEADLEVRVTNPSTLYGELTNGFAFVAAADPTFTSIAPTGGSTAGGNYFRIVGTNFKEGVKVQFGTTYAMVTAWSATTIQGIVPAHAAGATNVVITNLNTETVTGTGAYTYA